MLNRLLVAGMFQVFQTLTQEGLSSPNVRSSVWRKLAKGVLLMCSSEEYLILPHRLPLMVDPRSRGTNKTILNNT